MTSLRIFNVLQEAPCVIDDDAGNSTVTVEVVESIKGLDGVDAGTAWKDTTLN